MPGAHRIHITDQALADVHSIFDHIGGYSSQRAPSMIERILDAVDGLDHLANRFKVVGRSRKTGSSVHSVVVHPYIVYYRVEQQPPAVFVLTVRHGARRQPRRFD